MLTSQPAREPTVSPRITHIEQTLQAQGRQLAGLTQLLSMSMQSSQEGQLFMLRQEQRRDRERLQCLDPSTAVSSDIEEAQANLSYILSEITRLEQSIGQLRLLSGSPSDPATPSPPRIHHA